MDNTDKPNEHGEFKIYGKGQYPMGTYQPELGRMCYEKGSDLEKLAHAFHWSQ